MKAKAFTFLLIWISGCSNGEDTLDKNNESVLSAARSNNQTGSEDIMSTSTPAFESSLDLMKLSGRHDCSCTINNIKYELNSCDTRAALYCSDTLLSSKSIAYQYGTLSNRYWFANQPSNQKPDSVSLPNCMGCLTKKIPYSFAGVTRYFYLYVPSAPASKSVLVLHGNDGSAEQILGLTTPSSPSPLKAWLKLAERENFVLAIPDGSLGSEAKRGWNDCRADAVGNPTADDIGFLTALTRALNQRYGLYKNFATGMSNGGHMSIRLATEAPELFKGVAPISAAIAANSKCTPKSKPISVLLMRGTNDPISPYTGGVMAGNRGRVLSMNDSLSVFLSWNNIASAGTRNLLPDINTIDNSSVVKISYPTGKVGTKVEGYIVTGGGHTEPSRTELYGPLLKTFVGEQNRDIECADVVWNFFNRL